MSRLIFEGDTRERFGELFPKPFIEEIRVFDTTIETDVAVYFQIPEGLTAEQFLENTSLNNVNVYAGRSLFIPEDSFYNSNNPVKYQNPFALSSGKFETNIKNLSDFEHTFFYNDSGEKFVKFISSFNSQYHLVNIETSVIAYSFYGDLLEIPASESGILQAMPAMGYTLRTITDDDQIYNRIYSLYTFNNDIFQSVINQTSDISYHKVFNSDRSLNTGRQIVYIESDGNYYSDTPLRGLDRIYRKVNLITRQQVKDLVQATIQSSVGLLAEADLVSETLQKFINDPNLLLEIQKNINNFSNKSSATAIGTLYGQLVDVVVEIDNILTRSEKLEKRLIFTFKVLDRRIETAPPVEKLDIFDTQFLNPDTDLRHRIGDIGRNMVKNFIDMPFHSRYIYRTGNIAGGRQQIRNYSIENFGYLFFDYEKSLNYLTQISELFNPYNVLQLFGANTLNKYFKISRILIEKRDSYSAQHASTSNSNRATLDKKPTENENQFTYFSHNPDDDFNTIELYRSSVAEAATSETESDIPTSIDSRLIERAFDTAQGLNNYRLKCYEVAFLESATEGVENKFRFYRIQIEVEDRTMQFFEQHIHQKLVLLLKDLENYQTLANQFCSYNNIDNRFNDFFNNNLREEFTEPFVWVEAPKYFYSIKALIENSWIDSDFHPTLGIRNKNGDLIDMEKIKELSTVKNAEINPKTGNLSSIDYFVTQFADLVSSISYDSAWSSRIWDDSDREVILDDSFLPLKVPLKVLDFEMDKYVSNYIIDEYDYADYFAGYANEYRYKKRKNWSQTSDVLNLPGKGDEESLVAEISGYSFEFSRKEKNGAREETKTYSLNILDFLTLIGDNLNDDTLAPYLDNESPNWTEFLQPYSTDSAAVSTTYGDVIVENILKVNDSDLRRALRENFPPQGTIVAGTRQLGPISSVRELFQVAVATAESFNSTGGSEYTGDEYKSLKTIRQTLLLFKNLVSLMADEIDYSIETDNRYDPNSDSNDADLGPIL